MLINLVLLPSVFKLTDGNTKNLDKIATILSVARNRFIFLTKNDYSDEVYAALEQGDQSWESDVRQSATQILDCIAKGNKVVVDSIFQDKLHCQDLVCNPYLSIGMTHDELYFIISENCFQCTEMTLNELIDRGHKILKLDRTSIPESLLNKISKTDLQADHGVWDKNKFQENILYPIFKHSCKVQIYDRYIGRASVENEGYKNTLKWLVEFYKDCSNSDNKIFEIYTGVGFRNKEQTEEDWLSRVSEIRNNIVLTRNELSSIMPESCDFYLAKEGGRDTLNHARYIRTDQALICIESGLDLLQKNNRIRDFHAFHCSDVKLIDRHVLKVKRNNILPIKKR